MAKLVYTAIASLDGYVADADGRFDWAAPDEEVHAFVNDLERPIGTYLYGRRMYEVMVAWETAPDAHRRAAARSQDFAGDLAGRRQDRLLADAGARVQRQDADRAGLRPRGGPAAEGVVRARPQRGRARAAAEAIRPGLVDECHLFLAPIVVGGGTPRAAATTSAGRSSCWTSAASAAASSTCTTGPRGPDDSEVDAQVLHVEVVLEPEAAALARVRPSP